MTKDNKNDKNNETVDNNINNNKFVSHVMDDSS